MPWMYAVAGLLVGVILGVAISRLMTPEYKKQKNVQKELDSAKFALEQQRQELADHFAKSAEMLDTLGKDYTKLYQHMEKTSSELLPNLPEQDNPFVKTAAAHSDKPQDKS
ncbi:Z-ring associated protein ZapG, partial [Vibrio sp. 10N.222.48.A3]